MTKYAEIKNGIVVTISFDPTTGWPEVVETVFPGDIDNGDGTFSRPAPPQPTPEDRRALMDPLTARQLRHGLLNSGTTEAEVEALIEAIPDEFERASASIDWRTASQFERTHPLVIQIGTALGYTPEVVDDLWEFYLTI